MTFLGFSKFLSRGVVGVVGLSAIAVLGTSETVKATNLTASFDVSGVPVQTAVFGKYDANGEDIPTGTFATEMQNIDFSISTPGLGSGSVLVREDPTKTSTGQTTVTELGPDQYKIESFFDIFSQISLDGGNTWLDSVDANGNSASMRVELAEVPHPAANQFGCIINDPLGFLLPPSRCGYWSQFHSWFWVLNPKGKRVASIHLSNVFHFGFGNIIRVGFPNNNPGAGFGPNQQENFDSHVQGHIQVTMVPEPSATVPLALIGLAGIWGLKKKHASKQD